ncbi:hypothetical protein PIB30_086969, partial [Stylosanthes scabra]|nr:hypothetical protein [Stylosanthes scabra]
MEATQRQMATFYDPCPQVAALWAVQVLRLQHHCLLVHHHSSQIILQQTMTTTTRM